MSLNCVRISLLLSLCVLVSACHGSPSDTGDGDPGKTVDDPKTVGKSRVEAARAFWREGRRVRHAVGNIDVNGMSRVIAHVEIEVLKANDEQVWTVRREWVEGREKDATETQEVSGWGWFLEQRLLVLESAGELGDPTAITVHVAAGTFDGDAYTVPSESGPSGDIILMRKSPGVVLKSKVRDTRTRMIAWKTMELELLE